MVNNSNLVSAIVTNYNGWDLGLLQEFFPAFLKNDFKNFELFFVDNASTDESVKKVKEKFGQDYRLRIIQNPVNVMSAGIDMAMEKAKGRYILFLNNDIYFAPGAIKKMISFMEKNPEAALVQGKMVLYADNQIIDDVGETMDIYGNPVTLGAKEPDGGQYSKVREVLSASGAASLFRKSLIKKIGMLDKDYGIGYEDMDLAIRARIAGYKNYYLPDVLVFHRRGSSVSKSSQKIRVTIKYQFNKNRLTTLIKNYQLITLLKVLPIVILTYMALGLLEIFYKRLFKYGFSRFQALGWMLINLPTLMEKRAKVQKLRKLNDNEAFIKLMPKGQILKGLNAFLRSKKW